MFETRVHDAPFLTDEVRGFCSNIRTENGQSFDESFLATARALLYRRAEGKEVVIESYRSSAPNLGAVLENFSYHKADSCISLCLPRDITDVDSLSFLENRGFRKIEKVSLFFKKVMTVYCYVNDEKKQSVVILDNATLSKYHYLQTAMLNFFPWFYQPGSEISDEEKAFIRSLGQRDVKVYLNAMETLLPGDLREMTIRNLFQDFESQFDLELLATVESEVSDKRNRIRHLYDQLRLASEELRNKSLYAGALREKINSGESNGELMNYLLRNKKIVSVSGSKPRYTIVIKSLLLDYDEDEAEGIIRNRNSSLYRGIPQEKVDEWHGLFKAIFIDGKIKINTCAMFNFSTDGYAEDVVEPTYPSSCNDCLPNPHIHHHYCTGSFYDSLSQCAGNYDYVGVVEVLIAVTGNLNFSDDIVIREFSGDMYNNCDTKFLKLPDGSVVSPNEAICWLKEKEENNNG